MASTSCVLPVFVMFMSSPLTHDPFDAHHRKSQSRFWSSTGLYERLSYKIHQPSHLLQSGCICGTHSSWMPLWIDNCNSLPYQLQFHFSCGNKLSSEQLGSPNKWLLTSQCYHKAELHILKVLFRVDARQRVRNRTCHDLRRVDARRRVMHIHEPVIDSAQAQVINNNNGGRGACGGRKSTS